MSRLPSASLIERLQPLFLAGAGRPLAMVLLALLVGLNVASESDAPPQQPVDAATRAGMVVGTPFRLARQMLFDGYQRVFPRQPASNPVTIVAIDEDSLRESGQWPWPRNRLAQLIGAIAAHSPAAIGLDIYFPEADQTSPDKVADNLGPEARALAQGLRRLPDHDSQLAAMLHATPSVLGAAGFDFATLSTSAGMRTHPLQQIGADPLPHLRRYPWVLASLPQLQAAAAGQALLSVDSADTVVRRVPLVMAVGEQAMPGLALEMLRVATGMPAIEVHTGARGIERVAVADLSVPTQASGEVWLHYARFAAGAARYVPAKAVLAGRVDAEMLTGKLVLIGLTGMGLNDQRVTALREQVPGIEIQAQALESLFEGRALQRPWWIKTLESALLVASGVLFVYVLPRASVWVMLTLILASFAGGVTLFLKSGLLFDAAATLICLPLVYGSLMLSANIEVRLRNRALAAEQQRLREQALVVAGELSAARRIQLGSLPRADDLLRGETRFDLAAYMEPARDVGGDLYDFFMIDERRLGFVVGDVSGKGLPASLFMAVTKTLAQTIARHVDVPPGRLAELANQALSAENPENLFVTLLLGVLDVERGELQLINAGHDAPYRLSTNGTLEHLECPPEAGGPPLCMVDDFPYGTQTVQLAPGDTLVLITDGVTEAMNGAGEIYGGARLEACLKQARASSAEALIAAIRGNVARHVAGAEASDDMTLLVLRWTPATV